MTDDLRVLVETAMAEAAFEVRYPQDADGSRVSWATARDSASGHALLAEAAAALSAALSVRGPSGTPALVEMLMEQVGYGEKHSVFEWQNLDLDTPASGWALTDDLIAPPWDAPRPVFIVRTEEETP